MARVSKRKQAKKTTTKKEIKKPINKEVKEVEQVDEIKDVEPIEDEKHIEDKNINDKTVPEPTNPYNEEFNEKAYSKLNIQGIEEYEKKPIPEQNIIPPTIDEIINGDDEEEKTPPKENKEIENIDIPPEKKSVKEVIGEGFIAEDSNSSERLAKFVVRIYGYLWLGVGKLTNITPETVAKKIEKQVFHPAILTVELELEQGVTKSVLDLVTEVSEKIEEICSIDDIKEKELVELLTNYFTSKNWGLSQELDTIFAFGEDFITKTVELIATRSMLSSTLKMVNKQLMDQQPQQQPQAPTQQQAPPPPPQQAETETEIITDEKEPEE